MSDEDLRRMLRELDRDDPAAVMRLFKRALRSGDWPLIYRIRRHAFRRSHSCPDRGPPPCWHDIYESVRDAMDLAGHEHELAYLDIYNVIGRNEDEPKLNPADDELRAAERALKLDPKNRQLIAKVKRLRRRLGIPVKTSHKQAREQVRTAARMRQWSRRIAAMPRALRDTVVQGELPHYAWPGGYEMYYLHSDGSVWCPHCINAALRGEGAEDDQFFRHLSADINYEDPWLGCYNCGEFIDAAYASRECDRCHTEHVPEDGCPICEDCAHHQIWQTCTVTNCPCNPFTHEHHNLYDGDDADESMWAGPGPEPQD